MKQIIDINGQKYEERYLAQIIRRKMMSKIHESKKTYSRKLKHKGHEYIG